MEAHDVSEGDTVRVDIKNDAPIGGSTQSASFTVETVSETEIVGTDPNWGDTCTIEGIGTGCPRYTDGGKSGDVAAFHVVDV